MSNWFNIAFFVGWFCFLLGHGHISIFYECQQEFGAVTFGSGETQQEFGVVAFGLGGTFCTLRIYAGTKAHGDLLALSG